MAYTKLNGVKYIGTNIVKRFTARRLNYENLFKITFIDGIFICAGLVTHRKSSDGKRPLLVHNEGRGQVLEDCLFRYEIVGHYVYKG